VNKEFKKKVARKVRNNLIKIFIYFLLAALPPILFLSSKSELKGILNSKFYTVVYDPLMDASDLKLFFIYNHPIELRLKVVESLKGYGAYPDGVFFVLKNKKDNVLIDNKINSSIPTWGDKILTEEYGHMGFANITLPIIIPENAKSNDTTFIGNVFGKVIFPVKQQEHKFINTEKEFNIPLTMIYNEKEFDAKLKSQRGIDITSWVIIYVFLFILIFLFVNTGKIKLFRPLRILPESRGT
jgi:hypothetical protein